MSDFRRVLWLSGPRLRDPTPNILPDGNAAPSYQLIKGSDLFWLEHVPSKPLPDPTTPAGTAVQAFIRQLKRHASLSLRDERTVGRLRPRVAEVAAGDDIVRQGDRPNVSVFLLRGMLVRHHTLSSGARQLICLHIAGDMPDLQSLFVEVMDHSLMALDHVEIALLSHHDLHKLLLDAPDAALAMWRQTLLDAAIFREAVTNIGARGGAERLAHVLCEQYTRARAAGIAQGRSCSLPLTQLQLGQLLGMSLVSVNRAIQTLRKEGCVGLRGGTLEVMDWGRLKARADFDPGYLHLDLRITRRNFWRQVRQ
jgi:CRP-like cAMP-binding protein